MQKAIFNNPFTSAGWNKQFVSPGKIILAEEIGEVIPLISQAESAAKNGKWAALFVSYEASPAFDPAFVCRTKGKLPFAAAMIFDKKFPTEKILQQEKSFDKLQWSPRVSQEEYYSSIKKIKDYISAGDTYQVNYTFPLQSEFRGEPEDFYYKLCAAQRAPFCCFLDFDDFSVLSLSPELFFKRAGDKIITKPMKGTAARGRFNSEDAEISHDLKYSTKNRAENLMIVDLLRNDLGRIAKTGTVNTKSLFDIEKYDSVFQMTSTIEAECDYSVSLVDIFKALFPCGSVTGAPKVRTMEIINEVESFPRGIYTGALGFIEPGGDCVFNVPIRTISIDNLSRAQNASRKKCRLATFNVGGGIVADSTDKNEYEECITKSFFLSADVPDFKLLESLLLEDGKIFLFEEHIRRIKSSAKYFDYIFKEEDFRNIILEIAKKNQKGKFKIRALNDRAGNFKTEIQPLGALALPRKITFAVESIDSSDRFLFHKTTNRKIFSELKEPFPQFDDVILFNERGEITETTICNIVVEIGGKKFTPPVECGLLGGTFRAHLLARGEIKEKVIKKGEALSAEKIYLINSVRKWLPGVLL